MKQKWKKIIPIGVGIIVLVVIVFIMASHFSMKNAIHGIYQRSLYTNANGEKIGCIISFNEATMRYNSVTYDADTYGEREFTEGDIIVKLLHIELDDDEEWNGSMHLKYNLFTKKFTNGNNIYTLVEE